MKIFSTLCIFFLMASISTANETNSADLTCKPTETKKCDDTKNSKDWSHKREEQVAVILPEPQKDQTKSARPEVVKLMSPKFLSTVSGTTVKLEWSESSDEAHKAKFYHVQVSKDAGFNNRSMYVADEKWVKGNSFDVSNLEAGHKYFWRVAAVNNENDSMFTKSLFASSAFETK